MRLRLLRAVNFNGGDLELYIAMFGAYVLHVTEGVNT